MLFIVFGATLEMGYQSRRILIEKGFEVIKKYNYVSDDAKVEKKLYANPAGDVFTARWYDDKIYVDDMEKINKCDFRYELDGVYVGFDKEQIMEAVHGTKDAILTLGASSIKFITMLKKAYGGYITVINIFSDEQTVESDSRLSEAVSEEEIYTRIKANKKMQEMYLENINDFDEIVLYTGENTCYDMKSL